MFDRNYMDYHKDRFFDNSLMFYDGTELIAIMPANINRGILYSHGGLTYGGLIFSLDVHVSEVLEIFRKIGEYFFHLGENQG